MKKKKSNRISRVFFRVINIRYWLDWDRTKSLTLGLKNGIQRFFVPQKRKVTESFEKAKNKMHLNDADLLIKQKALLHLSLLMLSIALLIFGYAGYQLFYGSIKAFIVSLVVLMIALVMAFRYHFWYFQIKSRKLGCTFTEWYRQGLLGGKE